MIRVRSREMGELGINLLDPFKEFRPGIEETEKALQDMARSVMETTPAVKQALFWVAVSVGAMAVFSFVDFLGINPFRRKAR